MPDAAAGSAFDFLPVAPPDAVFLVSSSFREDTNPKKVNMGVGAYRTEEGKPWVLPVVRKVEERMATDMSIDHEYLPIDGLPSFTTAMARLAFGADSKAVAEKRVVSTQSLSGTGGLRIAAEFFSRFYEPKVVLVPSPTWENHHALFRAAGLSVLEYRYYDPETRGLNLSAMIEDLKAAPIGSIILLHQCAHNPTGVDPSQDEWKIIADVVEEKSFMVLFDSAYQGFVSGSPEEDGWAARYFESRGIEFFLVQSCAKNFGLYNERAGCVQAVLRTKYAADAVRSQMKAVVRPMYSNPPLHGAYIVSSILNDPALYSEWLEQLGVMSTRIREMREALYQALKAKGTPGTWDHIVRQRGMFTYTGLTPPQVERLTKEFHIYLLKSGRINMCGLNHNNLDYVASAIHTVVTGQ